MSEMQIVIPADFCFMPGVRACISRICAGLGFDDHEAYQIETVVDEICNNAVEHGSKTSQDIVVIGCSVSAGRIDFHITDSGNKEFRANEVFENNKRRIEQGWDLEEMNQRGRGLFIIQRMIDGMTIEKAGQGVKVSLYKIHHEEPAEMKYVFPDIKL
ncbi:MAG: ATP-binding protein [Elusimicrobia bacterium]|nr:ATP-binding protein [Elusimicrobiota bacterium]